MMQIFSFILGAGVGSFVNVLAWRAMAGQSVARPPSFCRSCRRPLWRRDLIPVVSFFLLAGRCRFCKSGISWQYPLVEGAVATLFLLASLRPSASPWELLGAWIAITVFVALFLTDWRAMVIPDVIALPALGMFLIIDLAFLRTPFLPLIIALAVGGGFFLVQYFISGGRWVGGGDIRFGLLMAAALLTWQKTLAAIFVSYIIGALVVIPLLLFRKIRMKSLIPLGTFLSVGALVMLFFGQRILAGLFGGFISIDRVIAP
ncbi:prepilin peptidase [Candidatus Uhrbacteria bacterium]|nr:prepilin peptidase [Candidatus Uhrbacteria bacterium]